MVDVFRSRMRMIWILILCVYVQYTGIAQSSVSIHEVLASYQNDSLILFMEETQGWAEAQSWRGSAFRELEFRTETNRFNWNQQEFTMRVSPRNFGENEYRYTRNKIREQSLTTKKQIRQAQVLMSRYQFILDTYVNTRRLEMFQEQKELLNEKIRLYALRFGEVDIDPVDLAKTETDLFEVESNIDHLTALLASSQEDLQRWFGQIELPKLVLEDMITMEAMKLLIEQFSDFNPTTQPEVLLAVYETEEKYTEWQLDRIRNNRWLDFVQARIRGTEEGFVDPRYSIGLAFNLPLLKENRSQNSINELKYKIAQSTQQQMMLERISQEDQLREKLLALIQRTQQSQNRIDRGLTQRTLMQLRKQEEQEPLTLLLLQEQLQIQQLMLLEIEQRVYEAYLLWLKSTGTFAVDTPRNFFSEQMEFLQD